MKKFASITLLCCLVLAACTETKQNVQTTPVISPPPAEDIEPSIAENPGSIFNPGDAGYLFEDNRARRVGDIVLVNVVENSSSTLTATTNSEKKSSMDFGVQSAFLRKSVGVGELLGVDPLDMKGNVGSTPIIQFNSDDKFEGDGDTSRTADISATVGARVVKVLPGGLMQIEGGREVRINDETQLLVVRGLVRPRDIGPDNSVLSSQLADAFIEIYGKGVLADRQKPGWLTRIIDNVWPF
ncbi:flagellar basal body L-ring protein FlgH [Oceanidesulfovibrio marinus]|uniref:Flagellar L-ring protein n=1 Tax=Oceanidesulfovibrio marinus TaxID=370038 RepID=A0A6P1ZK49_9BACT|nr:flagellar basal body L-ring protein FlgH [Oceanidesulfovibrio marinus]QJT10611.1 flagellar basal body L-ring protein [Oceanidesulfovibrio marinus]TVM34159.1 flagellar basal body L-ring protein [Oceanidesulfovibrio marinus]